MDVYIYQAALLCASCGEAQRKHLDEAFAENGAAPGTDEDDSDRYPQGPYPNGGGEADCPQHCDQCDTFLDNSLTEDGSTYVKGMWRDHVYDGRGNLEVLIEWREAYPCEWAEFCQETEEVEYKLRREAFDRFQALCER